jgi:hypothetical protein
MESPPNDPLIWYCPGCRNYLGRRGQNDELILGNGALIRADFRCLHCGRLVHWSQCSPQLKVEENGSRPAIAARAAMTITSARDPLPASRRRAGSSGTRQPMRRSTL